MEHGEAAKGEGTDCSFVQQDRVFGERQRRPLLCDIMQDERQPRLRLFGENGKYEHVFIRLRKKLDLNKSWTPSMSLSAAQDFIPFYYGTSSESFSNDAHGFLWRRDHRRHP